MYIKQLDHTIPYHRCVLIHSRILYSSGTLVVPLLPDRPRPGSRYHLLLFFILNVRDRLVNLLVLQFWRKEYIDWFQGSAHPRDFVGTLGGYCSSLLFAQIDWFWPREKEAIMAYIVALCGNCFAAKSDKNDFARATRFATYVRAFPWTFYVWYVKIQPET